MSRKTVAFRNPSPRAARSEPEPAGAPTQAAVDLWVHRRQDCADPTPTETREAPAALTFAIAAEPDLFEVFKIWFLLPYLALSFWTCSAAQRSLFALDRAANGGGKSPLSS